MIVFQYDKTFEGLLTALFHAYNRRVFPDRLLQEAEPLPLFCEEVFRVVTESSLADRVWRGAGRLLPAHFLSGITACWLSEQPAVDELLFRIEAVKSAEDKKYVLMNVPSDKVKDVVAVLPGAKSPTVMPLAQEGWSSVHTVIDESRFWEIITRLKELGAQGILVVPVEKMIL